jgi:hypothetical protein
MRNLKVGVRPFLQYNAAGNLALWRPTGTALEFAVVAIWRRIPVCIRFDIKCPITEELGINVYEKRTEKTDEHSPKNDKSSRHWSYLLLVELNPAKVLKS